MQEEKKEEKKARKQPVQRPAQLAQGPADIVNVNVSEFNNWLNELYEVSHLSDGEILNMYELLRYKGFNREDVLKQLFLRVPDKLTSLQIILATALQGPQRAAKTKLSNGRTPIELGIPASGQKGTQNLSCARISAATSDIAAYLLKKVNVPKRLEHQLPGWLQFPTAGSIKLPPNLRELHKDFSIKFSTLIGGLFNEQIYQTMVNNTYLDERLHLFDN